MINEQIVEVIKEGEIVRMTGTQAKEEDLFILRKIIEPERPYIEDEKPMNKGESKSNFSIENWKKKKAGYEQNNVMKDLIDNFHWEISRKRRYMGFTRKQLADKIGATEGEIKSLEFGELPRDDFVLINKIENIFGINLRKEKPVGEVTLSDLQKMNEEKVREELKKVNLGTVATSGSSNFSGSDIEILD